MKACPNAECAPVNVQITVGHQDAAFPLNTLTMTWQPEPPLNDAFSPISTITSVIGDGAQRVIALKANGKIFGSSIISREKPQILHIDQVHPRHTNTDTLTVRQADRHTNSQYFCILKPHSSQILSF